MRQGAAIRSPREPCQQPDQPPLRPEPSTRSRACQRSRSTHSRLHALPQGRQGRQSRITDFGFWNVAASPAGPKSKISCLNPLKQSHLSRRAHRGAIAQPRWLILPESCRRRSDRRLRSYLGSRPCRQEKRSS